MFYSNEKLDKHNDFSSYMFWKNGNDSCCSEIVHICTKYCMSKNKVETQKNDF